MKKLIIFCLSLMIGISVFSQAWKTYPYIPAGSLIRFPVDEGRHSSEPIEWWYTMGHLTGNSTGKHYSYMLSYFYFPVSIFDGFRILTISDDGQGLFYDETKALLYNILDEDQLNIEAAIYSGGVETWHNKTDLQGDPLPFEYVLSAASSTGTLNLEYNALKPPLILADSGYFYQGDANYTYYYAQTSNAVIGTITFNGVTEGVTGTSWIDRQYGTFNPYYGIEYEWFCIQLSNGMDMNVNMFFTESDELPNNEKYRLLSAYVDDNTQYTTSDFEIERLTYSYMPDSVMCYSQKWRITSPIRNVDLVVTTLHSNYEISLPFRFYEGPTSVTGTINGNTVTGVGFAELLHSYEKPGIQILNYAKLGDASTLLRWHLANPDEGNPLKYDLAYSIDNKLTFIPIVEQISDTFYFWNSQAIAQENGVWLKVTGYSVDATIKNSSVEKLNYAPSSLSKTENQKPIHIYPNPSEGVFTVEGENIRKIEIFTVSGKIIYASLQIQTNQIFDLSTQQKGLYFVKVTTDRCTTIEKLMLR